MLVYIKNVETLCATFDRFTNNVQIFLLQKKYYFIRVWNGVLVYECHKGSKKEGKGILKKLTFYWYSITSVHMYKYTFYQNSKENIKTKTRWKWNNFIQFTSPTFDMTCNVLTGRQNNNILIQYVLLNLKRMIWNKGVLKHIRLIKKNGIRFLACLLSIAGNL